MIRGVAKLAAILGVLGLAACAVQPSGPPAPVEELPAPAPTIEPSVEPAPDPMADTEVATLALLSDSEAALVAGDATRAITLLERGLRIEPRRADLWTGLARAHLANGDADRAEQLVRRAIALSGERLDWRRDAFLVLADVREAQGFHGEARDLRAQWRTGRG